MGGSGGGAVSGQGETQETWVLACGKGRGLLLR